LDTYRTCTERKSEEVEDAFQGGIDSFYQRRKHLKNNARITDERLLERYDGLIKLPIRCSIVDGTNLSGIETHSGRMENR
jgi:hypothetical protein